MHDVADQCNRPGPDNVKNPGALKQMVATKTKVLPFSKEIMDRAFKELSLIHI